MRKILILLLSLFSVLQSYSQCYGLVWSDEFNGSSIDTTKWSYELGGGGWGNSELESYTARPENSYVSNGNLYITALQETYTGPDGITENYTSARMVTQTKADWTYGKFEVRAKLPQGQGLWPAIWMMPTYSEYGTWPSSGEIDIMELLGNDTTKVYGTMHYGPSAANEGNSGGTVTLSSGGFCGSFHVFSVEWDSTSITWSVDSVPYYSQTKAGIAPDNWPFNKDFFFILNVSVGGSWPGSPDGTTQFPQSMIVDYVRVYQQLDSTYAKINGEASVFQNESGVVYNVPQLAGTTYTWQVPAGAQIVSGQGTNEIVVNWGNAGGTVTVSYSTSCGSNTINLPVSVIDNKCGLMYDDYENTRTVAFDYCGGTYQQQVANPAPDTVNPSSLVGEYTRNSSSQYDVLGFINYNIGNVNDYTSGAKKFSMDVYSDAPGTTINLQLEYTPKNALAYPAGRHSLYVATTTKTNQWEHLIFNFSNIIDGSIKPDSINTTTLLFAPNTYTGTTFYIDNFISFTPGACTAAITGIVDQSTQSNFIVYPNPADKETTILLNTDTEGLITVTSPNGNIVYQIDTKGQDRVSVPLINLTPGLYIVELISGNNSEHCKLVVE